MYHGVLHRRGATIAFEINAAVIGLPGGSVNRWTASLREIARDRAASHAPANKRPRWGHYGKPLKQSINRSRVKFQPRGKGFQLYATLGSTKHYARFVDQGTKAHQAKIIPPWVAGGYPILWEHTWIPPGDVRPIGTKTVKGIEAVEFFDKGVRDAFIAKRIRLGGPKAQAVAAMKGASFPKPNSIGSTPVDGAFIAQLRIWREERRQAWG